MAGEGTGMAGMRVLEIGSGIAAAYAGKLFVAGGADLIKAEPEGGDPLRHRRGSAPGHTSALFRFLNHGKRSAASCLQDDLLAQADVVLDSGVQGSFDVDAVRAAHPSLVVVSVSPFGRWGPFVDRPATEFTVQAESGAIALRGRRPGHPLAAGGRIGEYISGAYMAVAGAMGAYDAQATGLGDHFDVSMLEVHCTASCLFLDLTQRLMGLPLGGDCPRIVETPSIEPTKDGWVGFNTNTRQMFDDFLVLIDRPDLLGDEELARREGRMSRLQEWEDAIHGWTLLHTTEEILERASELRIPAAPVGSGATLLDVDHFKARGVFQHDHTGTFMMPRRPWRVNDTDPAPPGPVPSRPQSAARVTFRERVAESTHTPPLAQLRVLDMTGWWAGSCASQVFAHFGADVLHLESTQRPDGIRLAIVPPTHPTFWEMSGIFLNVNTNKRDMTIDLSADVGRDMLLRLVALSDVVIENFSPRVMENLRLDWPVIHQANPRTVMVRMPAFGLAGPWRNRTGFAQTMEQASGLAWITGQAGDRPVIQGGPCDPNAGMHAAFAVIAALRNRDTTGVGQLIEVPMIETSLNLAAEQVVEYTAYGKEMQRMGNRSPFAAPQNLYACGDDGRLIAVSVETDEQWAGLVAALGSPRWAGRADLRTLEGRAVAHEMLDEWIEHWLEGRKPDETVELLVSHGVPAGLVVDTRNTPEHPQLLARRFFEETPHSIVGSVKVRGLPFRSERRTHWIRTPAPTLGQHNTEVFTELLGFTEDQLAELERQRVIGTRPSGL